MTMPTHAPSVRLALPERRLLTRQQAADYCGISPETFRRTVQVAPVRFGAALRWDRIALDRWLDGLTKDEANMTSQDWLRIMDDEDEAGT